MKFYKKGTIVLCLGGANGVKIWSSFCEANGLGYCESVGDGDLAVVNMIWSMDCGAICVTECNKSLIFFFNFS